MAEGGEIKSQNNIPSDLLDDIASRFLLDASEAVLSDSISLCFKTEQAYWFYLDEYVEEDKSLKTMKLDTFVVQLLKHVKIKPPNGGTLENMLQEFREFKMKVPTYGGILLNDELSYVLLAQGFCPKDSWGFPKGKINVGEEPHKCAIREVLEETGYDISDLIEPTIFLEATIGERLERLYIIEGVPMDSKFIPKTKGEIKDLKWFNIGLLSANKNDKQLGCIKMIYMALPFVKPLRDWISRELRKRCNSTNSKKRRIRKKRHKSLTIGPSNAESNNSPLGFCDLTKKTVISSNKFNFDNVLIEKFNNAMDKANPIEESTKKFCFKTLLDLPQIQQTPSAPKRDCKTEYFRSETWSNFQIDKVAVNKVIDGLLRNKI